MLVQRDLEFRRDGLIYWPVAADGCASLDTILRKEGQWATAMIDLSFSHHEPTHRSSTYVAATASGGLV